MVIKFLSTEETAWQEIRNTLWLTQLSSYLCKQHTISDKSSHISNDYVETSSFYHKWNPYFQVLIKTHVLAKEGL